MGISIISYNGEVTLGLMVDENLIKDPQLIMERFAHQFDLLARQTLHAPNHGAGKIGAAEEVIKIEVDVTEIEVENGAPRKKSARAQKR
ncbi:MAG: DUF1298 domain-containing protein [Caldilineaceae bacterium]|nr:DUF1298 domain-containing protein [Caldilineaceae bacterium]